MKKVSIKNNATLQKDGENNFWLRLDVRSGESLVINLTSVMAHKVTHKVDEDSQRILEAFMAEQSTAGISEN